MYSSSNVWVGAERFCQDMGLATEIGRLSDSPLPLGLMAEKIYAEMVEKMPELQNKDFSSVYKYLQQRSG